MRQSSSSNRCEGTTASKTRCKRYAQRKPAANGLFYCSMHAKQGSVGSLAPARSPTTDMRPAYAKKVGDSVCPICIEEVSIQDDAGLECGHWGHYECIKQLRKLECPMCRHSITGESRLTKKDIEAIFGCMEEDKAQREEEDRQETERVLRRIREEERDLLNFMGRVADRMQLNTFALRVNRALAEAMGVVPEDLDDQ